MERGRQLEGVASSSVPPPWTRKVPAFSLGASSPRAFPCESPLEMTGICSSAAPLDRLCPEFASNCWVLHDNCAHLAGRSTICHTWKLDLAPLPRCAGSGNAAYFTVGTGRFCSNNHHNKKDVPTDDTQTRKNLLPGLWGSADREGAASRTRLAECRTDCVETAGPFGLLSSCADRRCVKAAGLFPTIQGLEAMTQSGGGAGASLSLSLSSLAPF